MNIAQRETTTHDLLPDTDGIASMLESIATPEAPNQQQQPTMLVNGPQRHSHPLLVEPAWTCHYSYSYIYGRPEMERLLAHPQSHILLELDIEATILRTAPRLMIREQEKQVQTSDWGKSVPNPAHLTEHSHSFESGYSLGFWNQILAVVTLGSLPQV